MMFARRFLLLFVLLAAVPAAAREAPYLTPQDLDLVSFLPTPIAAGSIADREQLALVLKMQQTMPADRIEQGKRDATETLDVAFAGVLGKALPDASLPATTHLLARLTETEDVVVEPAKTKFGRVRPYLADPEHIKALVRPSTSGSYPSGHATFVTVAAIVVGDMVPEKRDALWERARDYSWSRVIVGMHYPNDLDGGKIAGTAIAVAVRNRPDYKADYDAARRELRTYLGLTP
jgi:acid phosphatase (class A)